MSYSIQVKNEQNQAVWCKELSDQEYTNAKDLSLFSVHSADPIAGAFCIIRINSKTNFAQDLFLPTTLCYATRVNNLAKKIFAILGALVVDVIGFIPRIFSIPVVHFIYNHHHPRNYKKSQNPFFLYLKDNGADHKVLQGDYVHVRFEHQDSNQTHWAERNVNFIMRPQGLPGANFDNKEGVING